MNYKRKLACIYIIEIVDYYYIGCSVDYFNRQQGHYTQLKNGNHHSPKLQNLFNEFGITGMTFKVLEYISLDEYKKVHQMKGKELKLAFNRYVLQKEKEMMSRYSKNWCLNKNDRYFS